MKRIVTSCGIIMSGVYMLLCSVNASAETRFYRMDADFFNAMWENIGGIYNSYKMGDVIIAAPARKVALSTSNFTGVTYLDPVAVTLTDDYSLMVFDEQVPSKITIHISMVDGTVPTAGSYSSYLYGFFVSYSSGTKGKFLSKESDNYASDKCNIIYNNADKYNCQIQYEGINTRTYYLNYGLKNTTSDENAFILTNKPDEGSLSLYYRDYFNMTFSEPNEETGEVAVTCNVPNRNTYSIHYIINDGTPVTYAEILASEQYEELTYDSTNPISTVKIATADKGSKLWAAPVATTPKTEVDFIVGRIESLDLPKGSGKDDEGGNDVTTGVNSVVANDNTGKVYYNMQGVQIANPTAPGLYIVKEGHKTSKVCL